MRKRDAEKIKAGILCLGMIILLFLMQKNGGLAAEQPVSGSTGDVSGNHAADLTDAAEGILQLQVPENIDFVIDPWGIAGRGQIYSGEYRIRNCGTEEGVLYLSDMVCIVKDDADVLVAEDEQTAVFGEKKSICIEMVFDNGETLVLSREGQEYSVRLAPGEEITFWISGAVGTGRMENWKNNDVMIKMTYRFRKEVILY